MKDRRVAEKRLGDLFRQREECLAQKQRIEDEIAELSQEIFRLIEAER